MAKSKRKNSTGNPKYQKKLEISRLQVLMLMLLISALAGWVIILYNFKHRSLGPLYEKFNGLCNPVNKSALIPRGRDLILISQQVQGHMFGYNVWLSERTCLDRRLPDVQHQFCNKHKWMDVELPRASIILTYHQVDISAILRALHSIRERTPMELIREIILIDDATEVEELRSRDFLVLVNKLFGVFLRVRRLKEHVGVWAARKVGAEMAHGDVLVFMEPYIEVNVDWLPPLLLPLTKNWRVSTMPVLDIIDHATLRYAAGEPKRLAFDWHLHRMVLPLRAKEQEKYPEPHGSPVLNGKVFAITSAWFWEIDSYQTEYYNPPAVELELSFKIWQCGGRVLQASCSRVGYIKHKSNTLNKESMELEDFMDEQVSFRNLVEVWFDEYKQVVYETWPNLQHFKPDNLRMEFILRRRLQCRSARNFFEHVAPDIMAAHPFELPEDLANGELAMINEPKLCLSTEPRNRSISLRLRPCKRRSFQQRIGSAQYWAIGSDRSLKQDGKCLAVRRRKIPTKVALQYCNDAFMQKYWFYDYSKHQIEQGQPTNNRLCMEAVPQERHVVMNNCLDDHPMQQWSFTYVDMLALNNLYVELIIKEQFKKRALAEAKEDKAYEAQRNYIKEKLLKRKARKYANMSKPPTEIPPPEQTSGAK